MTENEKARREVLRGIENVHTMEKLNFSLSARRRAEQELSNLQRKLFQIDFPYTFRAITFCTEKGI